jgi:hypothetical protein
MRFRIIHLLLATALIGVFAGALSNPNLAWSATVRLTSWFAYAVLACRALVRPHERPIIGSALIFGLSYLVFVFVLFDTRWENLPTTHLLDMLFAALFGEQELMIERVSYDKGAYPFRDIAEIGLSFLFAFLGGLLGAYYSKSQPHSR